MAQDGRRWVDFPLVVLAIAVALYACAAYLAYFIGRLLPPMRINQRVPIEVLLNVGLLLATYKVAIRHLGAEPRDDLAAEGALRNLGLGLLAGVLIFSAIVGVAALSGVYRIDGCCSSGQIVRDLFRSAILAGFAEELLFRGILFRWIEEFAGSWAALILTSALFGIVHIGNPNATWFSSFSIAVEAGLMLGGAYMLTRSLWAPIGLHAAWNFTQGYVFDVPVSGVPENGLTHATLSGPALLSGGQFGLEASLFALVVATGAGVCFIVLAIRRGHFVRAFWTRGREPS